MYSLIFPDISHKQDYLDMIGEWGDFETIPTSPTKLFAGASYEDFLCIIITDLTANPHGVNSTLFFLMNDDEIFGALQVRYSIDHPNLSLDGGCGGHISYGLRPSARGKGLARVMLQLGLDEARKLGIQQVVISAYEYNSASWRTIESCGGILEKTIINDNKSLKVYIVSL